MPSFETFRRSQAVAVGAERRAAYETARLSELLPDLRAEARLEIELKRAASRLESARKLDALAHRIRELMRGRDGGVRAGSPGNAVPDLATAEREHAVAGEALVAVRERINAKDKELRQRFGLAQDS
jgi:hypothetical protein